MPNVLIDKNKIDILANAIAAKSGEPLKLTLEEMVEAVDGIETGGGGLTPTGNIDITQAGVTDVTNYATATVPAAQHIERIKITDLSQTIDVYNDGSLLMHYGDIISAPYFTANGWVDILDNQIVIEAVIEATGQLPTQGATTITPTESQQTAVTAGKYTTGAVTVSAIPSNYVGSGITRRSSSDLTASGATVTVPSGYYQNQASKAVANGTAGTPTATKGAVSNHAVSVTPSVTNTTGYITGSTKTGTAVTVSASELVSGSETKTANGTYDVTNLAQLVVNVSGGGTLTVATKTLTNNATTQTLSFSSLSGQPKYWFLRATTNVSSSGSTTYYYITDCFYDGTNIKGNTFRIGSTRRVQNITSGITQSYSGGTLTITAGSVSTTTPGQFYGTTNFGYELVYIY